MKFLSLVLFTLGFTVYGQDTLDFTTVGDVLNDSLLFSQPENRITVKSEKEKHLRRFFDPDKKRKDTTKRAVRIDDDIQAIHVSPEEVKYTSNNILLKRGSNTLLLQVGGRSIRIYGYDSFDKTSKLAVYGNRIVFTDPEETYMLVNGCCGCSSNDTIIKSLTLKQIFDLLDNRANIENIPLPEEPEPVEQIQLR